MRLSALGHEAFVYVIGLLGEAGVPVVMIHGGNELSIPDDAEVDPEVLAEIAASVRPGPLPAALASPSPPPGGSDAAPAPAEETTREQGNLPPRAGRGSGRDVWAVAAETRGLTVTDDMTRDQIIELVEADHAR